MMNVRCVPCAGQVEHPGDALPHYLKRYFCSGRAPRCRIRTAILALFPLINRREVINYPLVGCWHVPPVMGLESPPLNVTFNCIVPTTRAINSGVNELQIHLFKYCFFNPILYVSRSVRIAVRGLNSNQMPSKYDETQVLIIATFRG